MDTVLSPYSRRTAIIEPDEFFGRHRELAHLYDRICQRASIYLIGERRMGKSSLLNAIRFPREPGEYHLLPNPCFLFLNSLSFSDCDESAVLRRLLVQVSQELEAPVLDPARESLYEAARLCRENERQIVVLIDEIDVLIGNRRISPGFYGELRSWAEACQIPFVIALREGAEPLLSTNEPGSPLWNIMQSVYIGPMPHEEAIEMIRVPAEMLDKPFTSEQEQQILRWGGHHPLFLQMAADHTFRLQDPKEQGQAFASEAKPHFDYILSVLPKRELAHLRGERDDPQAEQELIRKGILIRDENGGLRIFSEFFKSRLAPSSSPETTSPSFLESVRAKFMY